MTEQLARTIAALQKNNIQAQFVEGPEDLVALLRRDYLRPGDTVAMGGTMTAAETGVAGLLACGDYRFLDRTRPGITPDEAGEMMRRAFFADWYITSTNAVTEQGELFNVDGNGNRVAAMAFGPKKVLVIAGENKIVPDLKAEVERVKAVAAPKNCVRLGLATPCAATGHCGERRCRSEGRICCDFSVQSYQRDPQRIHLFFLPGRLGY